MSAIMPYFRLLPQCSWGLRPSVNCWLRTPDSYFLYAGIKTLVPR